jgi:GNAT superfamily N-acetyltransferase
VEVRPARPEESEALARILMRSRNHGMDYVPRVPEEHLGRIAGDMFVYHDEVWLAEREGRPVGFLALRRSRAQGWETLEKLYVDPPEQGRGVGAVLLDKAKELRPDGLHLWVFQKNEGARRFYERHGFRLVKLTDGSENMEREPDALYAWVPSPEPASAASTPGSSER